MVATDVGERGSPWRYWVKLGLSTVVPIVLGALGVMWLARQLVHLQSELDSTNQKIADASATLSQLQAASKKTEEARAGLEQQVAKLQLEQERLAAAPYSDDVIPILKHSMERRPPRERAEALTSRAKEARQLDHRELATKLYQAAIDEDATYVRPMLQLGILFGSMVAKTETERVANLAEAERYYAMAVKATAADEEDHGWALLDLIVVLLNERKISEARQAADQFRKESAASFGRDPLRSARADAVLRDSRLNPKPTPEP